MPFNINALKANIEDFGYLKNNQYQVFISPPKVLFSTSLANSTGFRTLNQLSRIQTFRIDQVKAPGISLLSADINRYGVGTSNKHPFNAQFNEITFSVLNDEQAEIWQYWYQWIKSIYDFTGSEDNGFGEINAMPTFTSGYKDHYQTTIQIVVYNSYGEVAQRINLYEAFPVALREVPLAWADNNTLMKINVSITYSHFTMVSSELTLPASIFVV